MLAIQKHWCYSMIILVVELLSKESKIDDGKSDLRDP